MTVTDGKGTERIIGSHGALQGSNSRFRAYGHLLVLIVVSAIMAWQSLYKGWMMFVMVPLLFLIIPVLIVAYSKACKRPVAGHKDATRAVWTQLAGALLFYTCLPGMSDANESLLFAAFEADTNSLEVQIANWLSLLGVGLFLYGTFRVFLLVGRYRKKYDKV